jgi:RNA polymerase sigma-70 factor (ECF subfamily)
VAKMNLIDNFGYKEIADALDMPINTVKTKIRRAKAQLLKMMEYSDELL